MGPRRADGSLGAAAIEVEGDELAEGVVVLLLANTVLGPGRGVRRRRPTALVGNSTFVIC